MLMVGENILSSLSPLLKSSHPTNTFQTFRVVGPIKGYGGLRPSEEGRHDRLGRIDLVARKLLAVLGVVGHRPYKDHQATI